ncbi:hypothetical protein [Rugosimonospora acidiphila]
MGPIEECRLSRQRLARRIAELPGILDAMTGNVDTRRSTAHTAGGTV